MQALYTYLQTYRRLTYVLARNLWGTCTQISIRVASCALVSVALQIDAAPDRPAPGELKEKATPAKEGGTPIEGMVMGANINSYLRRGATFDVMRNVEAGVEDTGQRASGFLHCCSYWCLT